MINDLLTNHPSVYAVLVGLYSLFEYWIGKTPATRASSLIDLLVGLWQRIFWRNNVTIVDKTVPVAKETKEVIDAALALIRDFKAGLKPADIFAKDFQLLIVAATDSDQIPAERAANPDAFAATVGAGLGQILQVLLAGSKV